MKARCPYCQEEVTLDDERRGRPVRCPSCEQGFRAPLQNLGEGLAPVAVTMADQLMLGAAIVSGLGLLLTLVATLAHQMDHAWSVPRNLPIILLVFPFAAIVVSWWGARKTDRVWLVWLSRLLAYAWIAAMVLLMRLMWL